MSKVRTVYLDSNFCRNPHHVKQYGAYEGLALDLLIFFAAKTHRPSYKTNPINLHVPQTIYFHATDFCKEFGHPRQVVTQPLGPAAKAEMAKYPIASQEQVRTQLDYVLFMMGARNIAFTTKQPYRMVGPDRKIISESHFVGVIARLITNRHEEERNDTQAINYRMDVLATFIANNHYHGQSFQLDNYLNIRTRGGVAQDERKPTKSGAVRKPSRPRTWPAGRRLFVRLVFKWGLWQAERLRHLTSIEEDFEELCEIGGLTTNNDKLRASRLRYMLNEVCQLGQLPFTVTIEKVRPNFAARQLTGKLPPPYRIVLTKLGEQAGGQQRLAM